MKGRVESLRYRVDSLVTLREVVGLPATLDIREEQWTAILAGAEGARARLRERIERAQTLGGVKEEHELGQIELELSKAFTFFDTYMDVLTQRHSHTLGPLLAGCDVLAMDALRVDHRGVTDLLRPLVFCDRGLGASIIRQGVPMPGGGFNPVAVIQIPYSRLREKHTLTSVVHEVGHQALARMELVRALSAAIDEALARSGFDDQMRKLASLWAGELGPDFWTFCACGLAQASTIRELLALPPAEAKKVSFTDPHPPPCLRVLAAFDWCRQAWGGGVWDEWEREWLDIYKLDADVLKRGRDALPILGKVFFTTRFRALDGRRLPDLFDLDALEPRRLAERVRGESVASPAFWELRPTHQLSVFRAVREGARFGPEHMDRSMTKWLLKLAERTN